MDGELFGTISYTKGHGMRQETRNIDELHASFGKLQTVVSFSKHSNPTQIGSIFKMQTSQANFFCKTAVSRSSADAEITSLHAGLRMESLPSLNLWDTAIDVEPSAV